MRTQAMLATVMAAALAGCQSGSTGGFGGFLMSSNSSSDQVFDMPYLMRDLPNGLRVIIVPTEYPDIVTIQIPVQTGSRNEVEPGKSGFAHFFEHMMFRGTEKYPPDAYGEILKNAGADQNAYTTDDYTNYHITFTKADLEKVIELEADRFQNLKYSEEQFRTEALAVKGEYLKNYSNPIQKLFERMRDIAYTTHTYKHTTMGFLKDIEDMPNQLEYSRTFFDRWYRPEKTTVMLVGDVDPEKTFNLVKKYWGDWKQGSYSVDVPKEPPPSGPVAEHIHWEAPTQPWVMISFHGPAFDPDEKALPAMQLLSEIYFSESSDLYQKLVIKEQLADQLFPSFNLRKDPGLLGVAARVIDPANTSRVRDAMLETFARARTQRVADERLAATKSRVRYEFVRQMDNSGSIGALLARSVHFFRTPETINELYQTYAAVTPEDLQAAANRYFVDQGRVMVTLANASSLPNWEPVPSVDALASKATEAKPVDLKLVEMRTSAPLVDVSLLWSAGAACDPPGKKGLAALTADLITDGGSAAHSIEEINDARYPLAAELNNQVGKEMTRISGTVHRDNVEKWYATVKEQLLTPGWRQTDFDRIKTRQINAIRTNLVGNNDEELGKELLYASIYGPEHPYGHLTLGEVSDLKSLTLDDVKNFYQQYYTPENLTVGLAGGYSQALADQLRRDLAQLPRGTSELPALPKPPAFQGRQAIIVQKETPAVAVSFGFPIEVRRGDPDWVALWLARSWLGEHRSSNSHLYSRIRELRGMNYGDYAYIEYFPRGMFQFHPDANLGRRQQIFQVWIRPLRNNNDAHFATRVAMFELDKLVKTGLTAEQFEATRNYLDKFVSLLVKTQSRQLGYALDSRYYSTPGFTEYVRSELAKLTVERVNEVICRHLQTDDIKFVFITKDANDLRLRLVGEQSSPIEYNTPKPELAEEDQTIASWPLRFKEQNVQVIPADKLFE